MTKNQTPATLNYETAIAELEAIVSQMEAGKLPLEQSLSAYQRGAELLKQCHQSLTEAEQRVRILTESNQLATFKQEDI
ncbi:MAG TPA: exodeoxyribonuclease VII small subunit [Methylophilaceae bacterium]|nr:exodeoxyribonuclease VII small subunit [Methylophilaceae bacterium]HAJ72366.1 exodeoxyribonuclease VII small subunit [Methylophilaceae bacterium]